MNPEPLPSTPQTRRLFLQEPGWKVGLKVGSERIFCYMMAPGQDFYHRLLDGEIYIFHGDERICLACADRRGLLGYEARSLGGGSLTYLGIDASLGSAIDLATRQDEDEPQARS